MKETEVKKAVREGYAKIAQQGSSCCSTDSTCCSGTDLAHNISQYIGYSEEEMNAVPGGANLGLGCGNPVALASLKEGETVLDLGSGAGFDCFLAANQMGEKGKVIGVDIDQSVINVVNSGRSPYYEPGLAEMMARVRGNFTATDDYQYAVNNSRIIFIFVGTPSEADGSFATKYVEEVSRKVAAGLRGRDDFPVVVLRSTVLPGVSDRVVKPFLNTSDEGPTGHITATMRARGKRLIPSQRPAHQLI